MGRTAREHALVLDIKMPLGTIGLSKSSRRH